jgi:oligoendopeptidase F
VATLMDSKHYTAMASYQMYNSLAMILICLMVDEFEQIVYSTDISKFDAADFDAIMNQVCSAYFDVEFIRNNVTDVTAYWRAVVVEQPVYYISYAVSSIAALDLYGIAREDFAAAAEIYRKLCEEPMEDGGFLESISNVGLSGPFDEDFYIMLKELVKKSY